MTKRMMAINPQKRPKGQKGHQDMTCNKKPCGRQKDHEGRTSKPKPTEFEGHTPDACHFRYHALSSTPPPVMPAKEPSYCMRRNQSRMVE